LRRKTIGNSTKITSKKLTNGLQNNAERSSIYQKQYRAAAQKAKKLHQASLESNLLWKSNPETRSKPDCCGRRGDFQVFIDVLYSTAMWYG
jgi:hypothetical protein